MPSNGGLTEALREHFRRTASLIPPVGQRKCPDACFKNDSGPEAKKLVKELGGGKELTIASFMVKTDARISLSTTSRLDT